MDNLDLVKQITDIEDDVDQSLLAANNAAKEKIKTAEKAARAKLEQTHADLRNKRQAFIEHLKLEGETVLAAACKEADKKNKADREQAETNFAAVLEQLYRRCLEHGNC